MKKLLLSVILLGTMLAFSAPPFVSVTWYLLISQPSTMPVLPSYVPGTNQAYRVYATSTLGTPQDQWPLVATWTNWVVVTNNGSIFLSNNITLPYSPQYFFTVNPTNVWGEPPFSLGYNATVQSGPVWSQVNLNLNRQGP